MQFADYSNTITKSVIVLFSDQYGNWLWFTEMRHWITSTGNHPSLRSLTCPKLSSCQTECICPYAWGMVQPLQRVTHRPRLPGLYRLNCIKASCTGLMILFLLQKPYLISWGLFLAYMRALQKKMSSGSKAHVPYLMNLSDDVGS